MESLREATAQVFRKLPPFRGKTRAIRIVNWCFNRAHFSPSVVCKLRNGGKLVLDLRARTEFIPYYLGEYDFELFTQLTRLLEAGAVVLDVGGNVGLYAVPLGLRVRELGGKLFAFEPVPSNFARLKQNVELNRLAGTVRLEQIALSDTPGTLKMTLREDFTGGGETGNAAVLIDDGKDHGFETVDVPAVRFDDFAPTLGLQRIDLIKVDIEGHEGEFLRGARASILKFRPVILSEFNEGYFDRRGVDVDAVCREIFGGTGYEYYRRDESGSWRKTDTFKGRRNTDDVLLIPGEKAAQVTARLRS